MGKADLIDALFENAVQHFARFGFEGASLREIATQAGTTLGMIDRYFGSKTELYQAVLRQVWLEVERERNALVKQALARTGSERLEVGDLIFALARPIVKRALSDRPVDLACTALLRSRRFSEQQRHSPTSARADHADSSRSLSHWISALRHACPQLSRQEAVWAFSYISGIIYSRQLIEHRYDAHFVPEYELTVDGVTADIVAFGCAGVAALCAQAVPRRMATGFRGQSSPDRRIPRAGV